MADNLVNVPVRKKISEVLDWTIFCLGLASLSLALGASLWNAVAVAENQQTPPGIERSTG